MSHIRTCLLQSNSLSITVLLNALHSLIGLQQNVTLSLDDVFSAVTVSEGLLQNDIHLYVTILMEVALIRLKSYDNRETFQLNNHFLNNEVLFIQAVLECLYTNLFGESLPVVDNFIAQATSFIEGRSRGMVPDISRRPTPPSGVHAEEAEDFRIALERIKIQKQESIGRLLAQFRKFGMEILFPQIVYDKVLACVYAVLLVLPSTSHQELLEIILMIKNVRLVADIQHITKTKIRGVVTLLKHSKLLATHYPDLEQPAHLSLAPQMNSFQTLREELDVFLCNFIMEQHIMMPPHVMQYIVWPADERAKGSKIPELLDLIKQVEYWVKNCYATVKSQDSLVQSQSRELEENSKYDVFDCASTSGKTTRSHRSDSGSASSPPLQGMEANNLHSDSSSLSTLSMGQSTSSDEWRQNLINREKVVDIPLPQNSQFSRGYHSGPPPIDNVENTLFSSPAFGATPQNFNSSPPFDPYAATNNNMRATAPLQQKQQGNFYSPVSVVHKPLAPARSQSQIDHRYSSNNSTPNTYSNYPPASSHNNNNHHNQNIRYAAGPAAMKLNQFAQNPNVVVNNAIPNQYYTNNNNPHGNVRAHMMTNHHAHHTHANSNHTPNNHANHSANNMPRYNHYQHPQYAPPPIHQSSAPGNNLSSLGFQSAPMPSVPSVVSSPSVYDDRSIHHLPSPAHSSLPVSQPPFSSSSTASYVPNRNITGTNSPLSPQPPSSTSTKAPSYSNLIKNHPMYHQGNMVYF